MFTLLMHEVNTWQDTIMYLGMFAFLGWMMYLCLR